MSDEHLISLQPGTVIAGRYEVVKCLGAGSMGLVYACRHRELSGHIVAIKVLFPEVAQDKVAAARFRNEIFASYGVSHPNVVRAYEYLRDGDLVAYTMEYVGGGDLADRLGKSGQLMSVPEVVKVLSQMCAGVQAIHDAGIIHRDLKPENILLTKEGNVKIADFGIARTGHGPKLTEHGGVVGTIDYVSPEYILNNHVDWRSDIYAMGILAYEMLAGESPFRGDSVYATMTMRLKSDPPPPSTKRSDCPPELDVIVLKAMARNPDERYQSAQEMYQALHDLVSGPQPVVNLSSGSSSRINGLATPVQQKKVIEQPKTSPSESAVRGVPIISQSSVQRKEEAFGVRLGEGGSEPSLAERYSGRYETRQVQREPLEKFAPVSQETHIVSPEIAKIATQFDETQTIYEPMKIERVLAYNDLVSDGWSRVAGAGDLSITAGAIDSGRLERLSQFAVQGARSIWLDVVTVVAAVLIGVGIGYMLLKTYYPELVRSKTVVRDSS